MIHEPQSTRQGETPSRDGSRLGPMLGGPKEQPSSGRNRSDCRSTASNISCGRASMLTRANWTPGGPIWRHRHPNRRYGAGCLGGRSRRSPRPSPSQWYCSRPVAVRK